MNLTPDQLRTMGYDPSQPGPVLRKASKCSPHGDRSHFDGPDGVQTPPNALKRRLRQSSRPLMNKLEEEFCEHLTHLVVAVYPQAITFKLCNGVRFTPDAVAIAHNGSVHCYDVKGKRPIEDDASVKIKVAAKEFNHFGWYICWKEHDKWLEQKILST